MKTIEGNAANVTVAAHTPQHHIGSTSPNGKLQPGLETSLAPIFITGQEVLLSTAAAAPMPTTTRWWPKATGVAVTAIRQMLLTSRAAGRQPRQYCPKHYQFLERSCLAREMDRL